jgi:hypothetical protein
MKKIYYKLILALVSMMAMTMTSCDNKWDGPVYVEEIVGSWVSEYGRDFRGEFDLVGIEVVYFDFYRDHTGRYTYYSDYGIPYYIDFDWYTRGDMLFINYYDGKREAIFYGYDNYGYLLMSTDSDFYEYTAYRQIGMYYSPAKEAVADGPKKATKSDMVEDKVKSISRSIKTRMIDNEN